MPVVGAASDASPSGACHHRLMDAAAARLATSRDCLSLTGALADETRDALVVGSELRAAGHPPDLVAAAMTQVELRRAAAAKFGEFAAQMLFTRAGLEQATRLVVAARHAARFRDAGITRVADLTCGIGADAFAMAGLGLAVMAFERDEGTALIADHNLAPFPDAVVVHADAMDVVRGVDVEAVYADPGRRAGGARQYRPEDYEPPLSAVLALRDAFPAVGVKVGPGIPHTALPADVEAQWVSVDGDVVECGLWAGPLAAAPGRGALVLSADGAAAVRNTGAIAEVGATGAYLFEPDGAVIRAGLVGEVAAAVDARLLHHTIAYLTGDADATTQLATRYRVLDVLPYKPATLASYLRERGVGALEIKKRGMDVSPERVRKELKLRGDNAATVILTRAGDRRVAMIVERG